MTRFGTPQTHPCTHERGNHIMVCQHFTTARSVFFTNGKAQIYKEKPVQHKRKQRFTRLARAFETLFGLKVKEKTLAEKVLRYTIRHTKLITFGTEPQR
jgi:hypothetical protein